MRQITKCDQSDKLSNNSQTIESRRGNCVMAL